MAPTTFAFADVDQETKVHQSSKIKLSIIKITNSSFTMVLVFMSGISRVL